MDILVNKHSTPGIKSKKKKKKPWAALRQGTGGQVLNKHQSMGHTSQNPTPIFSGAIWEEKELLILVATVSQIG